MASSLQRPRPLSNTSMDIITEVFGKSEYFNQEHEHDEEQAAVDLEYALGRSFDISERPGNTLSYVEKVKMLEALQEMERRKERIGHFKFFPDEGPYSHKAYKKHIEFMNLGATHRERMFMAGNRVGKSIAGGYEMTCHLTGMYPPFWKGKRFLMPTDCWAAGDTGQTTRDIVQTSLLGEPGQWGTGLIPGDKIVDLRMRPGIPGAVDTVKILHSSGRYSKLGFKSYDQKRRAFQGTSKDAIWLDEEPPIEVYGECIMRTMTTNGIVFVTFTPLMGITPFVQEFLDAAREQNPSSD